MSARLKGRRREAEALLQRLPDWARERPDIRALGLVGSYAYGKPRMASDVDLVLLTTHEPTYTADTHWISILGRRARLVRTRRWGPITERRVRLASGLHVELGIGPPSWATTDPLDPGTSRVISDGLRILYDPDRLLHDAERATINHPAR